MRAAERLPDEGPTRIGSNRPTEHLAEHLVALYWRGRLDSDDPLLREFFERAEAEDRAYAISFAGHAVQHWDREFSSEPLARLVELWESRLRTIRIREGEGATELTSFGWLFTSRAFDPEWSLEQLLEVLTLTSGRIADDVEVVKRLSELAETNPRRAAEAIRLMLRVEGPVWWIHATTDELRQILRTALESDRSAAEIAVDAANDLGARGFIEFRDLRPLFPP
jgi:hypothetical protein